MAALTRLKKDSAYVANELWGKVFKLYQQDVLALKLMSLVISKIHPKETSVADLKSIIIPLSEVYDSLGFYGPNKLANIKKAVQRVVTTVVPFENDTSWRLMAFFDIHKTGIDKQNSNLCVDICDEFLPFLTNLKKFLRIRIATTKLSNRCFVFYCVLIAKHNKKIYDISLNELQGSCNVSYGTYGLFKQKFLIPVLEELSKVGINITFGEQKVGTRVEALHFTINEKELITIADTEISPLPPPVIKSTIQKQENTALRDIFDYYVLVHNRDPRYEFSKSRQGVIVARLKEGFTVEECKCHIDIVAMSDFHMARGKYKGQKVHNDLVDIIFNKTKFDKRIEEVNKRLKQNLPKRETKEEYRARLQKEEDEYVAKKMEEMRRNGEL